MASLVPFPINRPTAPLIANGVATGVSGWTPSGDAVIVDCWSGASNIQLDVEMLAYWGNNPDVEQSPGARSTRLTKTLTEDDNGDPLPPNRFVLVTVDVAFFRQGDGALGKFVGVEIGGQQFTPNVGASGGLSPNNGQVIAFGVTNADGELEVAFGCDNITVSCELLIIFANMRVAVPPADLTQIYYDAAVLYIGGNPISITRDGFAFDEQAEWEDYPYPGKANVVEGLEEVVSLRPVLRGKFMLTGEYQFMVYRPDGTWADHASIEGARTYTPADVRRALSTGIYLPSVLAVWRRPTDYVVVEFPRAICRKYALGSADKNEGEVPVEIEARVPSGSSSATVPYRLHTFPTGTTL